MRIEPSVFKDFAAWSSSIFTKIRLGIVELFQKAVGGQTASSEPIVPRKDIYDNIRHAKKVEKEALLQATQNASRQYIERFQDPATAAAGDPKHHLDGHIERQRQRKTEDPHLSALAALASNEENFKKEYAKLQRDIKKIQELLLGTKLGRTNTEVLKTLRKALKNPAYQLLKDNEKHPCVGYLHSLCLASYANTSIVAAFEDLGKNLDLHCKRDRPFHEALVKLRKALIRVGVAYDEFTVVFSDMRRFWKELGQVVHAVLSNIPIVCNWLQFLQPILPKEDPRIGYENYPGAFYQEKLACNNRECKALTVYTATPTVGTEVSPEFKAVLQAMENRQFIELENDPYPYTAWVYTNLQDITSLLENHQSVALMKLNDEYPFSFRGQTIAQNTPFFLSRIEDEPLDGVYVERFIKELTDEHNFTLDERRKNVGGGYYFHVPEERRKIWTAEVRQIVHMAYECMQDVSGSYRTSAFQELVHLGLMKLHQAQSVSQLSQKGGTVNVLETHACRSNIDRGGKTNPELLWGLSKKEEVSDDLLQHAVMSRSILERHRVMLSHCLLQMRDLLSQVDREKARHFLHEIGQSAHVSSEGIEVICSKT